MSSLLMFFLSLEKEKSRNYPCSPSPCSYSQADELESSLLVIIFLSKFGVSWFLFWCAWGEELKVCERSVSVISREMRSLLMFLGPGEREIMQLPVFSEYLFIFSGRNDPIS